MLARECVQGVRLYYMAPSMHIPKALPKETYEEWGKRTNITFQLQYNENLAGKKLLEVERIDGLIEVYNAKEIVPPGFKRNEVLGMLKRV